IGTGRTIEVHRHGKLILRLDRETDLNVPGALEDQLPFCDALKALRRTNVYSRETIDKAYVVKDLRNFAAHGELPDLVEWYPDEPQNDEEFKKIFDQSYKFPEAYQFWRQKGHSRSEERRVG